MDVYEKQGRLLPHTVAILAVFAKDEIGSKHKNHSKVYDHQQRNIRLWKERLANQD